jgi:hypothetical protein
MSKEPVAFVDIAPEDDEEEWPRTVDGALARIRQCREEGDKVRGTVLSLDWLYWFGEWETAFAWLQLNAPETAAQVVAEEAAQHEERNG